MGIGANIFAGLGVGSPPSPTVANATPTYGAPSSVARVGAFSPRHGFGMGFWWSVAGMGALVVIYFSLPR